MTLHQNLIAGEWTGANASPNINPPTPMMWWAIRAGHGADMDAAIAARRAAFPGLVAFGHSRAPRHPEEDRRTRSSPARTNSAGCCRARKARRGRRHRRDDPRRPDLRFLRRRMHAAGRRGAALGAPGVGSRSPAKPSAWSDHHAWNFPIAIPAWKIAPALAYGNTVVFKPADLVPGCAWAIVDILHRAGLPKGVLNLVMGRGSVVGQAMLDSRHVNAITFTGSTGTGKRVALASIEHNRKFQLEMGGKNPFVVLDDADLTVAVESAVNGAFFSTGQRCTASSRLIVTEGIHDRFVAAMAERLKGLTIDNALKAGTHIGPVVDASQLKQDEDYIDIGRKEGAKLVFGGERLNRETPGFYSSPRCFPKPPTTCASAARRSSDRRLRHPRQGLRGSTGCGQRHEFGLSSGIATTSLKHATHFKRNAEAGMVMVNLRRRAWISTCPSAAARVPPSAAANRAVMRRSSSPRSRPPIRWPEPHRA